jgi:hypothetical protein
VPSLSVTLPSRKRGRASKQRRQFGLPPKGPYPRYVVGPAPYSDNRGGVSALLLLDRGKPDGWRYVKERGNST